jgi:hypothetical protein
LRECRFRRHLVDDNDDDTGSARLAKAHSIYN